MAPKTKAKKPAAKRSAAAKPSRTPKGRPVGPGGNEGMLTLDQLKKAANAGDD